MCEKTSGSEVKLSWRPLGQNQLRGQLKHYTVAYQQVGSFNPSDGSNGGIVHGRQEGSVVVNDLDPFGNYSFMVCAETAAGPGPYSRPVFCTTRDRATTGPPVAIKVTPSDR